MKTPAFYRRKGRDIPCFINGHLDWLAEKGLTKTLVYWFDQDGEYHIDLVSVRQVREAEFNLT